MNITNLVVCPTCKTKLCYDRESNALICPHCRHKFQIVNGIVDAFPPDEKFKTSSIDLKKQYEHWGEYVTRGKSERLRREITIDLVKGDLLLEIGCAEGFMTVELTKKVQNVIASDISLNYLRRAKIRVPDAGFIRMDTHSIPFIDNTFDCVVCTEVLEHVLSPYITLEEIHRVLKPNGCLVLSVPNGMTFRRILYHLLKKPLTTLSDAHINFYDTGSILQMLNIMGFVPLNIKTDKIPLPFLGKIVRRLKVASLAKFMEKCFVFFGEKTIVKAKKDKIDYWNKLDKEFRGK